MALLGKAGRVAAELIAHCAACGLDVDQMLMALATAYGLTAVCANVKTEAAVALLVQQMMRGSISEANRAAKIQAAGGDPDPGWLS